MPGDGYRDCVEERRLFHLRPTRTKNQARLTSLGEANRDDREDLCPPALKWAHSKNG